MGEGTYAVPFAYCHATCREPVTSPDPPSWNAYARFAWLPAVTKTIPCPATGLGIGWLSTPRARQSSLPVTGSYETTDSAPEATSSTRCDVRTMTGVAQLRRFVRATRQTSLPVN